MRFACDTGGTFTDLIVEEDDGAWSMYKAATTAHDPSEGVLNAMREAAEVRGLDLDTFLGRADSFIHGTTHAINAIITGSTATTALLITKGHKDILYLREGGRTEPFNHTVPYPEPYIPRSLTYEVPERISAEGKIVSALDENTVLEIIQSMKAENIESIAICLLWSIINPVHEQRLAELLRKHLPDIPVSLSHVLNPVIREYRRACSTAIDASLKPLMSHYLGGLSERLRGEGFQGRVLVLTSQGGMLDAEDLARAPISVVNSGPSMAPVAGRHYGKRLTGLENIIVADTGGTTYDVSLVREGHIPFTRDMWIGKPFSGIVTGVPSVDVKSVGAGGGSIAWVDEGGVLHVGPQSAGAIPGPACYGKGGTLPTVTDASVVLAYIDPDFFLGGSMKLDSSAARSVIDEHVASRLGLTPEEAADAIIAVATENMVQAIEDITVNQGIDPATAALIGGGGAAGLNSVFVARRLGCPEVIIPEAGAALSAAGALISDLQNEYRAAFFTTSENFDRKGANDVLAALNRQCQSFIEGAGGGAVSTRIDYHIDARYQNQVWEIEVPLPRPVFESDSDVENMVDAFHEAHERLFAIRDLRSSVEIVGWVATVRCRLRDSVEGRLARSATVAHQLTDRTVYFSGTGRIDVSVLHFSDLVPDKIINGPAIIESPFTTVVVDPVSRFKGSVDGNLIIYPS